MAKSEAATVYRDEFLKRVKRARERTGMTQDELAQLLDLDQRKYEKYESRSLLPHRLINRFCIATGTEIAWLVTGEGTMARLASRARLAGTR